MGHATKTLEFIANTNASERWFARFSDTPDKLHIVGWVLTESSSKFSVQACVQKPNGEVVAASDLPNFVEVTVH